MKKYLYLCLAALFPAATPAMGQVEEAAEKVYFQCDFSEGMPEGFSTYDRDGYTLYFTMIQAGFDQGDSWICLCEGNKKDANRYAASASRYKWGAGETPLPSDDWLVTPAIYVRAADARLSWRGCSFCEQGTYPDTYRVLVSTTGNRPEDFTAPPLCSVEGESVNQWTQHEVSLGEYAGQRVYIAFVNGTTNGEILGVDDIKVEGSKGLYEMASTVPPYVFGQEAVKFSAAIGAFSDQPITHFTAYCRYDGQTVSRTFEGLDIRKGETFDFEFEQPRPVACGDTVGYDLWVEANGLPALDTLRLQTVAMLFNPERRVVVEEGTGMWCTYCPKGIVAMRELKEKYPDAFIGIAIHYEDPMSLDDYVKALGFPGFPTAFVNRKYWVDDPMPLVQKDGQACYTTLEGGLETWFLKAAAEQAIADLELAVELEGNTVKAQAQARYAIPLRDADIRLAFVVTEDNVCHDDYYQINNYSGSSVPIGGFENQPARIVPFTFDEVARTVHSGWRGIAGSQPEELQAGTDYPYACSFELPSSVDDVRQVHVAALLVDQRNGEVLNAASRRLVPVADGIGALTDGLRGFVYDGRERKAELSASTDSPVDFAVYDVRGVRILSERVAVRHGKAILSLPRLSRGIYLVSAAQGQQRTTHKIVVE